MIFAAALYEKLSTSAPIAAIAGDRIYPVWAQPLEEGQALQPTLVYRMLGLREESSIDRRATSARTIWQMVCLSESYDTAHELAQAVIDDLQFFIGVSGDIRILASDLEDAQDDDDPLLGVFAVIVQFRFDYRRIV